MEETMANIVSQEVQKALQQRESKKKYNQMYYQNVTKPKQASRRNTPEMSQDVEVMYQQLLLMKESNDMLQEQVAEYEYQIKILRDQRDTLYKQVKDLSSEVETFYIQNSEVFISKLRDTKV